MENQIIVVDTDILINASRKKRTKLAYYLNLKSQNKIKLLISVITSFEYLSGTYLIDKRQYERAKELLNNFSIQDLTQQIVEIAAKINRENRLYLQVESADILIGATALYFEAPLLTENKKHFKLIPGLRLAK